MRKVKQNRKYRKIMKGYASYYKGGLHAKYRLVFSIATIAMCEALGWDDLPF